MAEIPEDPNRRAEPSSSADAAPTRPNSDAQTECELTILMPCLNEAETLAGCIEQARDFLSRTGIDGEVLIADNGSTDGSVAIAQRLNARVAITPVKGYGSALTHGIRAARGRFVIIGDCDGSYDFGHLEPFVERLRSGSDLVMGNRFRGGIEPGAMPLLHRYLGNPVLSFLGRLFFAVPVGDFHCGLRGFRRDRVIALHLLSPGMEFATEMVVRAALDGLAIAEVPTTLSPDGRSRAPHLRTWRDGWRHLRFLLMLSPRWLFLYPGIVLLAAGALLQVLIAFGPLVIGKVVLDIHTMLFAGGAAIVGLQMTLFSVLAKAAGVAHRLLPVGPTFRRIVSAFSLERALLLGLALIVAGAILATYSLSIWIATGLSAIDPRHVMRIAIPSLTLGIAGMEIIFASFMLHFLLWNSERA